MVFLFGVLVTGPPTSTQGFVGIFAYSLGLIRERNGCWFPWTSWMSWEIPSIFLEFNIFLLLIYGFLLSRFWKKKVPVLLGPCFPTQRARAQLGPRKAPGWFWEGRWWGAFGTMERIWFRWRFRSNLMFVKSVAWFSSHVTFEIVSSHFVSLLYIPSSRFLWTGYQRSLFNVL